MFQAELLGTAPEFMKESMPSAQMLDAGSECHISRVLSETETDDDLYESKEYPKSK